MRPLPALRFVASHGIGELHLQGIVVRVLFHLFHALRFLRNVAIVLQHGLKQLVALLMSQGRCLSGQRIEQNRRRHLIVIVVGKLQPYVGEAETIEIADIAHPLNTCPVAIGNEVYGARGAVLCGGSQILVLHHHEQIARSQFILTIENCIANAKVIDICPFVRARHYHRIINAHTAVAGGKALNEFAAGNPQHVGKATETDTGQC